jgi:hypothetical protein
MKWCTKFLKLVKLLIFIMLSFVISCDSSDNNLLEENIVITPIDTQIEDAWVYFKDKPSSNSFLVNPQSMLSQRSINRRSKQNIALNISDVPIEKSYYNVVKKTAGITIMAKSKWLNALHIKGTKTKIKSLLLLSYVSKIEFADKSLNISGRISNEKHAHHPENKFGSVSDFNYGSSLNQIQMLGVDLLHQQNYTGNGMLIAVIDAGFPGVNTLSAFKRLRDSNKILGGFDFVNRNSNFYSGNSHGTSVLSTIAGFVEEQFVGTAPDASFYLFITEDSNSETPLEESLWVEAAERADSLGVDVINTSLGYYTFDNPKHDYTYADMNGNRTYITRGAEIAANKGMIVVNSAGNEGNVAWKYIIAPADANSVLSVGAVNATRVIAPFSSFGPTSDGRVKPDVLAHGQSVYVINVAGNVATSNGTSFASPIMAGAVACYWQKHASKTSKEIIQMVKSSAQLYNNPTPQEGYGIPKLN